MRFALLALLLAGMGCSASDDCQRAGAKLRPLVEERAREHGELPPGVRMSDPEKDRAVEKIVEKCRTKRKEHPDDPMLAMKCILAASDDAAVRACVAAANE